MEFLNKLINFLWIFTPWLLEGFNFNGQLLNVVIVWSSPFTTTLTSLNSVCFTWNISPCDSKKQKNRSIIQALRRQLLSSSGENEFIFQIWWGFVGLCNPKTGLQFAYIDIQFAISHHWHEPEQGCKCTTEQKSPTGARTSWCWHLMIDAHCSVDGNRNRTMDDGAVKGSQHERRAHGALVWCALWTPRLWLRFLSPDSATATVRRWMLVPHHDSNLDGITFWVVSSMALLKITLVS